MANELTASSSYHLLFANQQDKIRSTIYADRSTQEDVSWIEDIWSKQDKIEADALLHKHLEKCIISTLETKSHSEKETNEWDRFYQDNGTRFFKDRHYFHKDFPNEFGRYASQQSKTLVEVGCGVGNACLPLLEDEENPWTTIHAMDISKEGVTLMQHDDRFIKYNKTGKNGESIHGHVCDISKWFPAPCVGVADVTTLIFVLSALDPDDMPRAVEHVTSSLKPGGVLVFRDYGRYDEAQMKLGVSRNKRIKENFYRKHDGTKCYYFSLEDVEKLFVTAGLKTLELKYLRRAYSNKASGIRRRRVWVQARFVKPTASVD